MSLIKNAKYKDNTTYKYGTLTYTGKKKDINYGMGSFEMSHCFDYVDNNFPKEFGVTKKWLTESYIKNHLTAL